MKISLIGDFQGDPDEGMRKLCLQIEAAVRQSQEVLAVQSSDFCSGRAWNRLRRFRPHCLHYLTGPTIFSLLALRFHQLTLPRHPTTVVTGTRPYLNRLGRALLPSIVPDYYLAQARRWRRLMAAAGARIVDFPNGVDTTRFHPVGAERKMELKKSWGLPLDRPIVLHVGHVKENRNLDSLIEVQSSGRYQVWIVGSASLSRPGRWRTRLEEAGCRIYTEYLPAIEETYQAADVYAFTVKAIPPDRFPRRYREIGVIDLPLSVLEAMACGLRVVSTRHDALEHFLGVTPGVRFFDGTRADCLHQLDLLCAEPATTRTTAEEFDLHRIFDRLAAFHTQVATEAGVT